MLTKQQLRAIYANLDTHEKKRVLINAGLQNKDITKLTVMTLPLNQMNPIVRRNVEKILTHKRESQLADKAKIQGEQARKTHTSGLAM